jgi:hypothetical protein
MWVLSTRKCSHKTCITELDKNYIIVLRIKDSEIIVMSSEWLFQQLNTHHISEVGMLNDSADDKSRCYFG